MSMPEPGKFFVNAVLFFGVLIPGLVMMAVLYLAASSGGWLPSGLRPGGAEGRLAMFIGALILGYLAHPPAHLLNRAYDRFHAAPRRRAGDPNKEYAEGRARGKKADSDSLYAWVKEELARLAPPQLLRVELTEGISKLFRTLTLVSIVATIVAASSQVWAVAGAMAAVAVTSYFVFVEQRWAATKTLYQSYRSATEASPASSIITQVSQERA